MNAFDIGMAEGMKKVAAGPYVYHEPGAMMSGMTGKYVTHEDVMKHPEIAKNIGYRGNKGTLIMAPVEEITRAAGGDKARGKSLYDATRAHEMTHYMRGQRGKMKNVGKPGLVGIASTMREELAANKRSLKALPPEMRKNVKLRGIIGPSWASVRAAYPGQKMKDVAMGGGLGRLLRKARLLK